MISGASGSAGSSISTYRFSGGGYTWSSSTDYAYTTGLLTTAGTNTFTGTVTDTRGYSASRTLSVNVLPYESPAVTFMETYRAALDDSPSETGPNIITRFTTTFSSVDGKNTLTRYIAFRKIGVSTWSSNYTTSADGGWRLPANLLATDTAPYEIRIMLVDALSTTTQIFDVQGAQYTMFFANGGKNVSIRPRDRTGPVTTARSRCMPRRPQAPTSSSAAASRPPGRWIGLPLDNDKPVGKDREVN